MEPAHHFDSFAQQRDSANLGMWLFLVTEVLFFGGLFTGYTVYRTRFPHAFAAGSHDLEIVLGTINTAVLICSSLTMALAVRSAQLGKKRLIQLFIVLTMVLGLAFLGIKGYEYHHAWSEHHLPGAGYSFDGSSTSNFAHHTELFFWFYFGMTGLHAFHMIVGECVLLFVFIMAGRGKYTQKNYNFVEGMGLYWHFVDIIWIFLFPLLYLIHRHG